MVFKCDEEEDGGITWVLFLTCSSGEDLYSDTHTGLVSEPLFDARASISAAGHPVASKDKQPIS